MPWLNRLKIGFLLVALYWMSPPAWSLSEEETQRLKALREYSLEQLQAVKIKLDDVFDVFDGLVKRRKVSVASGMEQHAASAPAVTTVITAQDIEAVGARNLPEVLRMVPGLHVNYHSGYAASYTLRGLYSSTNPEVLFLLNGIPFKQPINGNRTHLDLEPVPVEYIKRIEIIRGPGSALYGADAFAGVINIITKERQDLESGEAGLRGGNHDSYKGWLLHGDKWGRAEVSAALSLANTSGQHKLIEQDLQSFIDDGMASRNPDYTPVSQTPGELSLPRENLSAHLDLALERWRWRLHYEEIRDRGLATFPLVLDPLGRGNAKVWSSDLTWHDGKFAPGWELTTQLAFHDWRSDSRMWSYPPGAFGGLYPEGVIEEIGTGERQARAGLNAFYHGLDSHKWHFGLGIGHEEIYSSTFRTNRGFYPSGEPIPPGLDELVDLSGSSQAIYPTNDRRNVYAFVQDSWVLGTDWTFTGGLRYDHYSDFGDTWNPRLALVWQARQNLAAKLLYGSAFRAPGFAEAHIRHNLIRGNPDLQPETLDTYELALDYQPDPDLNMTLNLFYYQVEDKIHAVALASKNYYQYRNIATWQGRGLEFETRWKLGTRASLLFNYAYVDNQEEQNGHEHDVGFYPHHKAYLRLDWMFKTNWFLDFQASRVMDRERAVGDNRPPVSGYTLLDLTLRYKAMRNARWNFALGIRNLLDTDQYEPSVPQIPRDFPQPGRNWFIEARYKF